MNDHPVHRDDITAMDKQGDLKSYMRSLIRPTTQPATSPRRTRRRWGAVPIPADHKPGTWPTGTSPPGPPPDWDHPPQAWADAVRRYRTETRHQLDQEDP
ncbi:MAG: hypothetical protein HOV68_31705 [Streptomycetaceae bacterium]|nr:hypothetical protein [Streptomycetaceae bacterium]